MDRKELALAKKWLEETFMKEAEIVDCKVRTSREGEIITGVLTIKVPHSDNKIRMNIRSDSDTKGFRAETYMVVGDKKEEISGYYLRKIFEGK